MMSIDRIQYEVTGDADEAILQTCRLYDAEVHSAKDDRREFMEKHGAKRGRPGISKGLVSLIFPKDSVPKGWKPLRRQPTDLEPGDVECGPDRRANVGKQAEREMNKLSTPTLTQVMYAIGRKGEGEVQAGDGSGRILFASPRLLCLEVPEKRYVLDLPMHPDDDWLPPAGLVELRQSEFWRLVEAHNDRAKASKQAA